MIPLKRLLWLVPALLILLIASACADTVTIPSGLTEIPEGMFDGSSGLDRVVIGSNITSIGSRAFAGSSVATVSIADSVTYIADDAFDDLQNDVIVYTASTYVSNYCEDHGIICNPSDMEAAFAKYTCVKADWWNSDIQGIFFQRTTSGGYTVSECVAQVYDIWTGLTYTIRRVGGDNHADIEPYTKEDTAILCQTQGVSDPSQIDAGTPYYKRRPCLLLVGTHLYACSMYAVPHDPGYRSDANHLLNNGLNGYVMCLWFVNSKGHGSGKTDSDHAAAINTAYNWWLTKYGK